MRSAQVQLHMAAAEAQGDRLLRIGENFGDVAQHAAADDGADVLVRAVDGLAAQRKAEAVERDDAHFAFADLHQAAGQNRSALIDGDRKDRPADHVAQHALGHRKGRPLDLRQLRVFDGIHARDRCAGGGAADRRLKPVGNRKLCRAGGQLAHDLAKQLAREDDAALLCKGRGDRRLDAQRKIRAGQAQALVAGFKEDALQNLLGGADGQRAADDGEARVQIVGIAGKAHIHQPPWGSSSIYIQQ